MTPTEQTLRTALEEIAHAQPKEGAVERIRDFARAALTTEQAKPVDMSENQRLRAALANLYNALDSCFDLTPEIMAQARAARAALAAAPSEEQVKPVDDEWLQSRGLLYVLKYGVNHYEVNVTMAGTRSEADCTAFATRLLPLLATPHPQPAIPAAPKHSVQDIMFEVYEYAILREGIDDALGSTRDEQRKQMSAQAEKIRAMILAITAAPEPMQAHEDFAMQSALDKWNAQQAAPEQVTLGDKWISADYLHSKIKGMQEASYCYGETCKESVEIALDGVLYVMEAAPSPQQRDDDFKIRGYDYLRATTKAVRSSDGTERVEVTPEAIKRAIARDGGSIPPQQRDESKDAP
jgi:hypothetical protein